LEGRGKIARFLDAEKRIGAEQTARAWTPYN